jgi:hypothetical protein
MMTRKDYVATATILNNQLKINNCCDKFVAGFDELVDEFILMFEKDNERFDSDRFWEACFAD